MQVRPPQTGVRPGYLSPNQNTTTAKTRAVRAEGSENARADNEADKNRIENDPSPVHLDDDLVRADRQVEANQKVSEVLSSPQVLTVLGSLVDLKA